MKRSLAFLLPALLSTTLFFSSCADKDAPDKKDTIEFETPINGAQAGTNSTGTGTFTGTYNKVTKELSYNVTYSGITPTAAHIHTITDQNTQTGPVTIPFTNVTTSPITGTARLTQEQENNLIFRNMYVNLHTRAFPNGEIRGNIRQKNF